MGNQLFQYCLGRIIAERLGFCLNAGSIRGFPGTSQVIAGRRYSNDGFPTETLFGHRIDLDATLSNIMPRRVLLDGWFQRWHYFAPYEDMIRGWLDQSATRQTDYLPGRPTGRLAASEDEHREDLLLHIRLGDFCRLGIALSADFYDALLSDLEYRHAYMLTDEISHPMIQQLIKRGLQPLNMDAAHALNAGRHFGKLIIGQGTFSWWLAFFAKQSEIHVGLPSHHKIGSMSIDRFSDGPDLRVDQARYHYYYHAPLIGVPSAKSYKHFPDHKAIHQQSTAYRWE